MEDRGARARHTDDEDRLFNLLLRDFGERNAVGGVVQPVHGVEQCSFASDEFTCGIELRVGIERIHESAKTFKEEFTAVTQIGSPSCALRGFGENCVNVEIGHGPTVSLQS